MGVRFSYDPLPGKVLFSRGAARQELPAEIDRLGWRRIMVIATDRESELVEKVTHGFADRVAVRFDNVLPHVPREVAADARAAAAAHQVDGMLAIGGGSTTGTAKIVALTTRLPIVAVPTTYAGSEMTPVWGMTDDRRKETGRSMWVLPQIVIYDPCLVESLPVELTIASALNALAHCVESLWVASASPVTSAMALEGARLLRIGLGQLTEGQLPAASDNLLQGAYLAGAAFAVTGSGLHHKMCHVLGGTFDLPHAQTHATVLPHVLAFNEPGMGDTAGRLADALGGDSATTALRSLYDRVNPVARISALRLTPDQVNEAADIMAAKLPVQNPVPVDRAAIESILMSAFSRP